MSLKIGEKKGGTGRQYMAAFAEFVLLKLFNMQDELRDRERGRAGFCVMAYLKGYG